MANDSLDLVSIRLVTDRKLYSDDVIRTPDDAVAILGEEISLMDREAFAILCMDSKKRVLHASIQSIGGIDSALISPREVMKTALLSNAAAIILMHNHPSGDVEPSNVDISLTYIMIRAGEVMDVDVLDHIIVGPNGEFYSLRENQICWIDDVTQFRTEDDDLVR